ncbi:aldose epimerase [Aphanothece hegewaldii CCALA 016]|uniref:Aldose epimerase n=1 Tax=Aphanothece hegewaldii CCALA 016 TaxID=2107694 RepID=A0A2T1LV76_9CHRO|nr:aldose epimerase [Aphanothece hegewaldii]PSF35573.1 aldose epimerase [Aphanothece hegewaldii CCALA 016]
MFTITDQQNQYLTYILSDSESDAHLKVVPDRGGIITHWQIKGKDILYLDEKRFADPTLSVRGGNPILFPICGNLPNNTYTHKGETYTLKQHGFARDLPWQVIAQNTDNCASLTISLESNPTTKAVYPFNFQLAFTYQLQDNRLKIIGHLTNHSTEKMPFSWGFHPYFLVEDKNQLVLDIPATQYQNQITQEIHPFTGGFDFNQDEIDVAFKNVSRSSSGYTDYSRRHEISLTYSDIYSTVVFWTVKGKDYICLEPWSAPRNALNTGKSLLYVDPGATFSSWVEMSLTFSSP